MDLDNDGILDLISGAYVTSPEHDEDRAPVHFFKGRSRKIPKYELPQKLTTENEKPLNFERVQGDLPKAVARRDDLYPSRTKPTLIDLNKDGNLDLVYGEKYGYFVFFQGRAGKGLDRFSDKAEFLMADGQLLQVKNLASTPHFVDWDSDGDLDILSGSQSGGVYFAENVGTATVAKWKKFEEWVAPPTPLFDGYRNWDLSQFSFHGIVPWMETCVSTYDYNSDGKLDLVVGDRTRIESPLKGVTNEMFLEKDKNYRAVIRAGGSVDEMALSKTYKEIKETGFVWVYLQK